MMERARKGRDEAIFKNDFMEVLVTIYHLCTSNSLTRAILGEGSGITCEPNREWRKLDHTMLQAIELRVALESVRSFLRPFLLLLGLIFG